MTMNDWELDMGVDGQEELVPPMWDQSRDDHIEWEEEYSDPFPDADPEFDDLLWNVAMSVLTRPVVWCWRLGAWIFRIGRRHAFRTQPATEKRPLTPTNMLLPTSK